MIRKGDFLSCSVLFANIHAVAYEPMPHAISVRGASHSHFRE